MFLLTLSLFVHYLPLAWATELWEYPSASRAISVSWLNSRSRFIKTNSACSSLLSASKEHSWCSTTQNTGSRVPGVQEVQCVIRNSRIYREVLLKSLLSGFLCSDQVPLECQLVVVGFWVGHGLSGRGLPCLPLSGLEGPMLCCSNRAILAGGGRELTARSLDSVFLIPSHSGSICCFTLLRHLNIGM